LRVYPRDVGISSSLRGDEARLGDEQRALHRRPLSIVLDAERYVRVYLVGAESGEGREDDAMGEREAADFDGREELGGGGGHFGEWLVGTVIDSRKLGDDVWIQVFNNGGFEWFITET
jgi:hypothetical protein